MSVDVLQELYLKELRGVKPLAVGLKSEGGVKQWIEPVRPAVPAMELSKEQLAQYREAPVETIKDAAADAEAGAGEHSDDWLVLDEIEDSHSH